MIFRNFFNTAGNNFVSDSYLKYVGMKSKNPEIVKFSSALLEENREKEEAKRKAMKRFTYAMLEQEYSQNH